DGRARPPAAHGRAQAHRLTIRNRLPGRMMDDKARIMAAQAALQSGRTAEGQALAAAITNTSPFYPQALHLHGVALSRQGRHAEGTNLLRSALELGDMSPSLPVNLAVAA